MSEQVYRYANDELSISAISEHSASQYRYEIAMFRGIDSFCDVVYVSENLTEFLNLYDTMKASAEKGDGYDIVRAITNHAEDITKTINRMAIKEESLDSISKAVSRLCSK
jgi:hypothetical protein